MDQLSEELMAMMVLYFFPLLRGLLYYTRFHTYQL